MNGEPGGRPRALAGLAESSAGASEDWESVVVVASGGTVSVVRLRRTEVLVEDCPPPAEELLCVMGPPGVRRGGSQISYSIDQGGGL